MRWRRRIARESASQFRNRADPALRRARESGPRRCLSADRGRTFAPTICVTHIYVNGKEQCRGPSGSAQEVPSLGTTTGPSALCTAKLLGVSRVEQQREAAADRGAGAVLVGRRDG